MEKLTQKWAIAAFFNVLPDGFEFNRTDIPLHITFAGVFAVDLTGNELLIELKDKLTKNISFSATAVDHALWGENKEIQVILIEKSIEVLNLKSQINKLLRLKGAVFNEPQFEGDDYIPHSTVQKSGQLKIANTVKVSSISLVDMFPNGSGQRRRIVGSVIFDDFAPEGQTP